MNKQRLAILITAAVGALSTFMPWVKFPIIGSVPGTDMENGLGWISFVLFGVAIVLCILDDKQKKLTGPPLIGAIITPSLSALIGIWTIWNFYARIRAYKEESEEKMEGNPLADVGEKMVDAFTKGAGIEFGLYFVVLAGILIPLFALLIKDKDEVQPEVQAERESKLVLFFSSTKAFIGYFIFLLILPFIFVVIRSDYSDALNLTYIGLSFLICSLLPFKMAKSKSFTRLNSLFKVNLIVWAVSLIWLPIQYEISFFGTYGLRRLYFDFTEYYTLFFILLGGLALTADVFEKEGRKIDSFKRLALFFNHKILLSTILIILLSSATYKLFTVRILGYEEMETFRLKNDTFSGSWYYLNKDTTAVEFVNFNYNAERFGTSGEVTVEYSAQIIENGAFQVKNYSPKTSMTLDYTQQISFPLLFDDVIKVESADEKELKGKIFFSNGSSKGFVFYRDNEKLNELVAAKENRQMASESFDIEFGEAQEGVFEKSFVVNSEKTYFHNGPNSSQRRKAYLVKGDTGTFNAVVDGFVFVRYTNSRGAVSEGWVQLSDLEVY
jgi:hypothetical protein